ncbi:PepSY domain-containing protein [Candidatus Woesearchaeota archaeon]|nr:PepSY domain-containing protein [Candidatus Woesearchaeota archaeon]
MEFKDALMHLEKSKEFVSWRKEHKGFLAHAFKLLDDANADTWQLGYYDGSTITTFVVSARFIEVIPDQEILRSEHAIEELDVTHVKISSEDALKTAREFHQLHHPREMTLKQFFIIQKLPSGVVYNVTFFFQSMKTLNVKIDAASGKVVQHSFQSLMEMDGKS